MKGRGRRCDLRAPAMVCCLASALTRGAGSVAHRLGGPDPGALGREIGLRQDRRRNFVRFADLCGDRRKLGPRRQCRRAAHREGSGKQEERTATHAVLHGRVRRPSSGQGCRRRERNKRIHARPRPVGGHAPMGKRDARPASPVRRREPRSIPVFALPIPAWFGDLHLNREGVQTAAQWRPRLAVWWCDSRRDRLGARCKEKSPGE
jgi:hypothetical protein